MNILLSSVGRRPYLVRWFREALAANGQSGSIIAADLDPTAPAQAVADDFVLAPRVGDPGYRNWLGELLAERQIGLAVSINDFELSEWAQLPRTQEWEALVRLTPQTQGLVEDKFAMGEVLNRFDVPNPRTWLGGDKSHSGGRYARYVTKGRFGSASRGLRFTDALGLEAAVSAAAREVTTRQGQPALEQMEIPPEDLVIVQEQIVGEEYGLDVVCDLEGTFAGVLARRKIAMRSGETDRAESVEGQMFEQLARRVAQAVPHPGTIDVDVIINKAGVPFVIDINPRFGGGYPFSHLAGARIPNAYIAWAAGLPVAEEWLAADAGVIGGKFVEAGRIS